MDAAYVTALVGFAGQIAAAGHGEKEPIYQRACAELGRSRATIMKHLKKVAVSKPRKVRSDAGAVVLSLADARVLSAYLMEGYRKNNRKITALKEAVEVLRLNGRIAAAQVDEETGEMRELSDSAIARALRVYCLHPEQLREASACTNLQSLHPNHVWEVDASVCVIYYLPDGGAELVELDKIKHYKNKPENLKAIEQFRVIRYVLADHCSGVIRYRYYPHAESGEHTVRFLAWAMAFKGGNDPFHGAPLKVMVDPGATSGGLVARFCLRLGIELIINKVGNARAKGSVEKGNHLIETSFEQTLRYMAERPSSFAELNALAEQFQLYWNAKKVHTRTGKTRFAVWLTITAEQLRVTPGEAILLELATKEPVSRQVQQDLTVEFKNRVWDVQHVPGVYVKAKVFVHWHPFFVDTAMAVVTGADGREVHFTLPEVKKNEYGFVETAAVIGEAYQARPDSVADTNRKAVSALAAGVSGLAEVEKKRKGKHFVPFDGAIDPLIAAKAFVPPVYLPRAGTDLGVAGVNVVALKLGAVEMMRWMMGRLGDAWRPEMNTGLRARFPEGATEAELESVLADLEAGRSVAGRAKLSVVG